MRTYLKILEYMELFYSDADFEDVVDGYCDEREIEDTEAVQYKDKLLTFSYDRSSERFYRINRYNHRYNSNPFNIDGLYKEINHRPFIQGRKGELEMLIMYEWLLVVGSKIASIGRNMSTYASPRDGSIWLVV